MSNFDSVRVVNTARCRYSAAFNTKTSSSRETHNISPTSAPKRGILKALTPWEMCPTTRSSSVLPRAAQKTQTAVFISQMPSDTAQVMLRSSRIQQKSYQERYRSGQLNGGVQLDQEGADKRAQLSKVPKSSTTVSRRLNALPLESFASFAQTE